MTDRVYNTPPAQGTPPHQGHASREDWILQQINNLSRESGVIQNAIESQKDAMNSMTSATNENTKSINSIKLILAGASGGAAVAGAVVFYLIDKKFDQIIDLIAK